MGIQPPAALAKAAIPYLMRRSGSLPPEQAEPGSLGLLSPASGPQQAQRPAPAAWTTMSKSDPFAKCTHSLGSRDRLSRKTALALVAGLVSCMGVE